jgi:hypothetical protein
MESVASAIVGNLIARIAGSPMVTLLVAHANHPWMEGAKRGQMGAIDTVIHGI